MIATLRTPISKLRLMKDGRVIEPSEKNKVVRDAVLALIALGVKESTAQSAVERAAGTLGVDAGTNQIITEAFKLI